MNKRFTSRRRGGLLQGLLLPVLFFAVILGVFWYGINSLSGTAEREQLKSAEQSVRRAAVHCYAVEGQYPSNYQYLVDHYGLMIDPQKYVVHYQRIAGNLMPEIAVFATGMDGKAE